MSRLNFYNNKNGGRKFAPAVLSLELIAVIGYNTVAVGNFRIIR